MASNAVERACLSRDEGSALEIEDLMGTGKLDNEERERLVRRVRVMACDIVDLAEADKVSAKDLASVLGKAGNELASTIEEGHDPEPGEQAVIWGLFRLIQCAELRAAEASGESAS
ncbi:unnamed protein product [marine sediment metagenome]|uniref:Uncharacterized protein n=1 Tax=marine sediment metagenome TaxID=412755 RepID=X0VXA5_9ZZZZ